MHICGSIVCLGSLGTDALSNCFKTGEPAQADNLLRKKAQPLPFWIHTFLLSFPEGHGLVGVRLCSPGNLSACTCLMPHGTR